jgi:hypothetical protein
MTICPASQKPMSKFFQKDTCPVGKSMYFCSGFAEIAQLVEQRIRNA